MKTIMTVSLLLAVWVLDAAPARADYVMVPESRHQLFQAYGFFLDPQNDLFWRSPDRGWGAVGGVFPLVEFTDWKGKPQILLQGSANAGYLVDTSKLLLRTQTIDARVGLLVDVALSNDTRLEIGWTHESGHIADDVPDASLIGPNLGNEIISVRVIHDIDEHFRFGGTFKPVAGAAPHLKTFGADQFAEWFPWGQAADVHHHSLYAAVALEETGVDHIIPTFQGHIGILWGNHFREPHTVGLRLVAGYYNGIDPRLKYAQYMLATIQFGYAGMAFDF